MSKIRGQQLVASAISSNEVDSTILKADGTNPLVNNWSAGNHKITYLADPTNPQDAVTKIYADSIILATDAQHGNRGGGSLHIVATGSTAGFMSAADFTKLAGIPSSAVPTTRSLIAGNGLTGGGDLSADRTFDVVANVDGSIIVNSNDIQVGILATDAQHGNRGGGSLHAVVVAAGAAGFMSGADKTKLDGISAGAAALTSSSPADIDTTSAAVGTSTTAARADHKHDISTAAGVNVDPSTSNAEGSASTLARSDHTHKVAIPNSTATATGTTTTTSATDVLINSMTLTPGAGDYTAIFQTSISNSSEAAITTVSFYVNGAQVSATEVSMLATVVDVLGITSDIRFPCSMSAIITGVGAGQAIEVRWRTTAGTATAQMRRFSLIRIN